MQENTLPWVIKLVPAVVGAILALVLSGDIDKDGKIQVTLGVIGKFLFSVSVSLYGGAAFIEYYELNNYSHMAQGFVMLIFAVFGLLAIGIVYQSIALMHGKSLAEVAKYWIKRPPIPVCTIPVIPIRAIPQQSK